MEFTFGRDVHLDLGDIETFLPEGVAVRLQYHRAAAKAAEYVLANAKQRIRLADAARAAYLSDCSLSRLFTEKIGMRFADFVRVAKVAHAIRRLQDDDCAISTLADELGYVSVSTFIRNFKFVTGKSPSGFRSGFAIERAPAARLRRGVRLSEYD